jgi:threonine aldolase
MAFSDGVADFRSDTVTRPTDEMLAAMVAAPVGDDVYEEDPTVNRLEEAAAAVVGKEAGVFTPSGSMANQLALNTQTRPGDKILTVAGAHVRNYENGAASAVSGLSFRTVDDPRGEITPEDVAAAAAAAGYHMPRVTLLVWENPLTISGGTVIPLDTQRVTSEAAWSAAMQVHFDGARIFNAALALGVDPAELAATADTVMFCFSKGLGAPIGSILCGPADIIGEARFVRKRLGGGMRQVGVIAAAADVALRDRDRLVEDHVLARRIAEGLHDRFPDAVDLDQVQTNMVLFDTAATPWSGAELIDAFGRDHFL